MNLDIAVNLDLLTHQLSQSLLLELSIVKDIPITQKASNQQYEQFLIILDVLCQYVDKKITYDQARISYRNWLTSRGFGISDILENWKYLRNIKLSHFLTILSNKQQSYLNVEKLSSMLDFLNLQLNESLDSSLLIFNGCQGIQKQQPTTQQQLKVIEEIYTLFDEDGKGFIESDRILLLFQTLLFSKESALRFEGSDVLMYKKQYLEFCKKIGIYEGKLTVRLFKQFFILNQIYSEEDILQIRKFYYQFLSMQRFKLIDKSFYLVFTLNPKQKALWITNFKNKIDSSSFIRQIQKTKQFNKLIFENMILCDQYARILYLFLIENFESLKYYFDQEKIFNLTMLSEELTKIFNSSYSQNQAILTMVENVCNLFFIFSDAYYVILRENQKIFASIYSSFQQQQQQQFNQPFIKSFSFKSKTDQSNKTIKSFYIDLEIPDYQINKNLPENFIYDQNTLGETEKEKLNNMADIIEKESQLISPVKQNVQKQYSTLNKVNSPMKQDTLKSISYLTSPQLRSNNQIFSPLKLKNVVLNQQSSSYQNSPSQNFTKETSKIQQSKELLSQELLFFQNQSVSQNSTPMRSIIQKTSSLSPQKNINTNFSYLEYLKSQIDLKKQNQKMDSKPFKLQSMLNNCWEDINSYSPLQKKTYYQTGQGVQQVYQQISPQHPKQFN
ncbi:hypothetical protein ABPG72_000021 [Tetrahymena utriculariae]